MLCKCPLEMSYNVVGTAAASRCKANEHPTHIFSMCVFLYVYVNMHVCVHAHTLIYL